jgi:hypothetical protein
MPFPGTRESVTCLIIPVCRRSFGRIIPLDSSLFQEAAMKSAGIALVLIAFAAGATSLAQDMAEYSHAAASAASSVQGLANKLNLTLQKPGTQASSGPQVQTLDSSKPGAHSEAVAKPTPPALFIFADGKQLESSHYVLTAQNLVIQDGPKAQTIPLTAINQQATIIANQKRGLNLKFPTSMSQMTISF